MFSVFFDNTQELLFITTLLFNYHVVCSGWRRMYFSYLRQQQAKPYPVSCFLTPDFFGGHSEEVPPVPIPNTAVKLFCADGTAWEAVWESRTPPTFYIKAPLVLID